MSVFTQRMSTFNFQLHKRCQLRQARFYLAFIFKKYSQNQRMKFPMAKTEKHTWHWNGQIGDFKLYNAIWGKKIGKKQPVVIGLSALFFRPVTCRCRPDMISLGKHWSRDLFQKHKRLWLEQGCHSQRFPLKAVFMFFCHSSDFLETICFFFSVSKADLSSHQIEPFNNVTLTIIVFPLKNIPEILFCADLF